MRLPLKSSDSFSDQVNKVFEILQACYLAAIKPAIAARKVSAMLGDGTVTEVESFDPRNVRLFYTRLINSLQQIGWETSGISDSKTEDLHRLFCSFSKEIGKYYITSYFGIQFHALPYYKVDKRVIEIQKELTRIAEDATALFKTISTAANSALHTELKNKGYADLGFQELFAKMFDDEKLADELDRTATKVESQFPEFEEMRRKKSSLFEELNDLVMELYQTSAVGIDYNKLMQGEEGVTTYFDIEVVTNMKTKTREAYVNTQNIGNDMTAKVISDLTAVAEALKSASSD